MSEVVDLLHELVEIDSVNPGLVEGAAGEQRIVEHLEARLRHAGFTTTIVGRHDRPSLVAVAPGDGPTVMLNGHLDTVGVAGMPQPFTPRIEGDRLFGRGAADMKGGVAGLVVTAENLMRSGTAIRPALALVADEEDASQGSEAVIAALPEFGIQPGLCLIAEPTDLALCRSLRGFAVVRVTFSGRAAHSSQPELGVNAVTHLGRLLNAVDQHGDGLMVTVAHGGRSPFVVPDQAECIVEMRSSPDQSAAHALPVVEGLLRPEWQAEAELLAHRDGWRLDSTGPAADFATSLGAALGTRADLDAPYWMEAPLWQAVCPTVICGPSGGGLHAVDEFVDRRQVESFTTALTTTLTTTLGGTIAAHSRLS